MDDPFLPTSSSSGKRYIWLLVGGLTGALVLTTVGVLFGYGATKDDSAALIPLAVGIALLGVVCAGVWGLVHKGVGEEDGSHRRLNLLAVMMLLSVVVVSASSLGVALSSPAAEKAPPAPPVQYAVGGTLTGFSGGKEDALTLQNNGRDDLEIYQNGNWQFRTKLDDSAPYSVTVSKNPPRQTCTVANPSGTVSGRDVNNVEVTCR